VNFGRVYCDFLVYIFYSSIFWDTRRWIKSKSTIRSIVKSCLYMLQLAPNTISCIYTSCVEAVALVRPMFLRLVAKMTDQFSEKQINIRCVKL